MIFMGRIKMWHGQTSRRLFARQGCITSFLAEPSRFDSGAIHHISVLCSASLLAILLIAGACSKPPTTAPVANVSAVISDEDAVGVMRANGVIPFNGFAIADSKYDVPAEKWLTSTFLDELRAFQFQLKQTHYISESNDCDDFAKMASAYARLIHANGPHGKGTSITVGEFYYTPAGSRQNHAINVAIVSGSDGKLKLVFFDPQTWSVVKLSRSEVESCLNWIL